MKAICTTTFNLDDIPDPSIASFAVLSRQGRPVPNRSPFTLDRDHWDSSRIPDVVIAACRIAAGLGINHLWDRDLCVDQSSSAEVALSINESRQRLESARVAIVYLGDLSAESLGYNEDDWERCGYWKEATATTDFILSRRVEIYDSQWNHRCSKTCPEFTPLASNITGVPISVLREPAALANVAVGIRIAWYAAKSSARPEDLIYSLAPILGVQMQIIYGEGRTKAFCRLQEQVLHDSRDSSIFAWRAGSNGPEIRGIFAHSPAEFAHLLAYQNTNLAPWRFESKVRFTNNGAEIRGPVIKQGLFTFLDIRKQTAKDAGSEPRIAIQLRECDGVYVRVGLTSAHTRITSPPQRQTIDIIRDADPTIAGNLRMHIEKLDLFVSTGGSREGLPDHHQSEGESSMTLRPKEPTGLKRSRSGRPLPPYASRRSLPRVYQGYYSSDSSESESDDSNSESESDSDDSSASDRLRASSEYEPEEEYILEESNKLHSLRPDILNSVFDSVQICVSTAEYKAPPVDRLPPLKRARTTNWNSLHEDKGSPEALEDPNMVIIPRQRGYFHFSCPYYLRKPEKYQACLLGHDLQSIEDVIHHLQEHHTEPPYCPICRQPFERALVRDNHVRARVCQVSQGEVDGVNERQKRRLEKKDRIQLGETRRWARIWNTVFPGSDEVPEPYMSSGPEREISIIRDFWDANGLDLVSEYMGKQGIPDQHEPEEIAALSKLVLQDILGRVLRDRPTSSET
ncbi:unnamed protein product [Clonostachys rhizophaga]|uniref:Heterokaryon incompatibility domain-containing protein n=1 Tax=Clonostachys rhizophaga TaxID=160324 RepID=A0A9N9VTU7_9HYPO|nr:unnamed protein product [Clonostachys rhizophaga]